MEKDSVNEYGYTDNPENLYKAEKSYIMKRRVKNGICDLRKDGVCKYIKCKKYETVCIPPLKKDDKDIKCKNYTKSCLEPGAAFCEHIKIKDNEVFCGFQEDSFHEHKKSQDDKNVNSGVCKEIKCIKYKPVCKLSEEDGWQHIRPMDRERICGIFKDGEYGDLWGICYSGGGIRSATFCLGVMQGFIKSNLFKLFDYLSTVSGGGYIGCCLTSLLSKEPESPYRKAFPKTFKHEEIGVDPENSPFSGLNEFDETGKRLEYKEAEKTILNARHQMHHLRTHGEYLISNRRIFRKDMQRFLGAIFAGVFHHLFMFTLALSAITALIHFFLFFITMSFVFPVEKYKYDDVPLLKELNYSSDIYYRITDDTLEGLGNENILSSDKIKLLEKLKGETFFKGKPDFLTALDDLSYTKREMGTNYTNQEKKLILDYATVRNDSTSAYLKNHLKTWLFSRIGVPLYNMFFKGLKDHFLVFLLCLFLGAEISFRVVTICKKCILNKLAPDEEIEEKEDHKNKTKPCDEKYKQKIRDATETADSGATIENQLQADLITWINGGTFIILLLTIIIPGVFYLLGEPQDNRLFLLFLPLGLSLGASSGFLTAKNVIPLEDLVKRSMYNTLVGACFYSVCLSIIIPIGIVFIFSLSYFDLKFWWALISISLSYFLFKGAGKGGKIKQFLSKYRTSLSLILIILFITLFINYISHWLITLPYPAIGAPLIIFDVLFISVGLILFAGYIVNSNRVSPHYFYRDRLAEAYLKTDARVERNHNLKQGKPLINLRNHENLLLKDIGGEKVGPYHILVTALNLQGSDELNRKKMLSEHFIFSKYYVGSKVTGYMKTENYRVGKTKLARAMTISAAAASSAMGKYSSAVGSFAATLFNVRLGYWMENPWDFRNDDKIKIEAKVKKKRFWPCWLFKEMMGRVTARKKLINLSDGGHTGDNLGLMPLLERRCKVIVVCDAEADYDYDFESFNNAVRMIYIEKKIDIKIDLSDIKPEVDEECRDDKISYKFSKKSVAIGDIIYPPLKKGDKETTGKLIYIKSSISQPDDKLLPVHVKNYNVTNRYFPHQTTTDQFFDDAQFEAYRTLGIYIAEQAIVEMADDVSFTKDFPRKIKALILEAKRKVLQENKVAKFKPSAQGWKKRLFLSLLEDGIPFK